MPAKPLNLMKLWLLPLLKLVCPKSQPYWDPTHCFVVWKGSVVPCTFAADKTAVYPDGVAWVASGVSIASADATEVNAEGLKVLVAFGETYGRIVRSFNASFVICDRHIATKVLSVGERSKELKKVCKKQTKKDKKQDKKKSRKDKKKGKKAKKDDSDSDSDSDSSDSEVRTTCLLGVDWFAKMWGFVGKEGQEKGQKERQEM